MPNAKMVDVGTREGLPLPELQMIKRRPLVPNQKFNFYYTPLYGYEIQLR